MKEIAPEATLNNVISLDEYRASKPEREGRSRLEIDTELGSRALREDRLKTRPRRELEALVERRLAEGNVATAIEMAEVQDQLEEQQASDVEVLAGVMRVPLALEDEWYQMRERIGRYFAAGEKVLVEELNQLEFKLQQAGVGRREIIDTLNDAIATHYIKAEESEVEREDNSVSTPEVVAPSKKPTLRIVT